MFFSKRAFNDLNNSWRCSGANLIERTLARLGKVGKGEKFRETVPASGIQQVRQRVFVECTEKGVQGFSQDWFELANRHDGAGVRFHVKTLDDSEVCLCEPHDVSQPNLVGIACQ